MISIRAPLAGSDRKRCTYTRRRSDFNPRSPCGERQRHLRHHGARHDISIRAPLAGSDNTSGSRTRPDTYFNPRSPCGERRVHRLKQRCLGRISIRAPLAGSDMNDSFRRTISIEFQSALPLRGATGALAAGARVAQYFNPRSPCGERPLHFVASIYYQQSVVFSKTVTANSVDKLRKTTAKSAITRCEPHS